MAENYESFADALRGADLEPKHSYVEVMTSEVLSVTMETNLSKHQYLLIRDFINSKLSFSLLPSYENVLKEKKKSYADKITVNESQAEVELQSLLDHTASRILDLQSKVLEDIPNESANNLVLIGKWGFDGNTAHSEYKQKYNNSVQPYS